MLIDVRLKGSYLEENYWPEVYRRAETEPRPVAGVYANLPQALSGSLAQDEVARQLNLALAQQTNSADTHPALADRLRALGYPAQNGNNGHNGDWTKHYRPATVEQNAADYYLGRHAQALVEQFDRAWQEGVAEQWGERHDYVRRSQKTLAELEEKAKGGTLLFDEAWTRARLALELKTTEEAVALMREALALSPDHAEANFRLGQMLLKLNDPAGVAHLERASERDRGLVIPACQVLYAHFAEQGQPEEAERYRERANKHFAKLEEAQPERSSINSPKELIPHEAAPAVVERLREQLSAFPQVKAAYLAQKKLDVMPEKPLYVLGVVPRVPWYQLNHDKANRKLVSELAEQLIFPEETLILALTGSNKKYIKKGFRRFEGSRVLP
jgi:tetratricopeptide (TPR) repeat protein